MRRRHCKIRYKLSHYVLAGPMSVFIKQGPIVGAVVSQQYYQPVYSWMQGETNAHVLKAHHSRQVSLWKRLRFIKKCSMCRKSTPAFTTIRHNLAMHNSPSHEFTASLLALKIKNTQQDKPHTQLSDSGEDAGSYVNRSLSLWSSLSELGVLAHYYRFYEHIPVMPREAVFELLGAYKNRKKIIQYNRIWLKYNSDKSASTTKHRTSLHSSERLLKGLNQRHEPNSQEELTLMQGLNADRTLKKLSEIDQRYEFSGKNTEEKGFKKKARHNQNTLAKSAKKTTPHKVAERKKHHKSCESIEKYDNKPISNLRTQISPLSPSRKKRVIRSKDSHGSRSEKGLNLKAYIKSLRKKINQEKLALCRPENFETVPQKHKKKKGKETKEDKAIKEKKGRETNIGKTEKRSPREKIKKATNRYATKSCVTVCL